MKRKKQVIPRRIARAFPSVMKIIDATHSVQIHVNAKDCKDGEPLNPNECALAKAVQRQFKADAAIIGLGASYIIKGNKATRFHTPEKIRREMVSFDRHHDFEQGDYTLIPKSPAARFEAARSYFKKHRASKMDKRRRHDTAPVKHVMSARVRVLSKDSHIKL